MLAVLPAFGYNGAGLQLTLLGDIAAVLPRPAVGGYDVHVANGPALIAHAVRRIRQAGRTYPLSETAVANLVETFTRGRAIACEAAANTESAVPFASLNAIPAVVREVRLAVTAILERFGKRPPTGTYETLWLELVLDLVDTQGERAVLARRQGIRFHGSDSAVVRELVWSEGDQLREATPQQRRHGPLPGLTCPTLRLGTASQAPGRDRAAHNAAAVTRSVLIWSLTTGGHRHG